MSVLDNLQMSWLELHCDELTLICISHMSQAHAGCMLVCGSSSSQDKQSCGDFCIGNVKSIFSQWVFSVKKKKSISLPLIKSTPQAASVPPDHLEIIQHTNLGTNPLQTEKNTKRKTVEGLWCLISYDFSHVHPNTQQGIMIQHCFCLCFHEPKGLGTTTLKTLWEPESWFQIRTSSKLISPENNQPCNAWSSVSTAPSPRRSRLSVHLMAFKWMKYCLLGTVSTRLHFISQDVKFSLSGKEFNMTCGLNIAEYQGWGGEGLLISITCSHSDAIFFYTFNR